MKTKTVEYRGITWNLPPRGRLGPQIAHTIDQILNHHPKGIAYYAAAGLRGKAKEYAGRYQESFARFAKVNPHLLKLGAVGPKGGSGWAYIGPEMGVDCAELEAWEEN